VHGPPPIDIRDDGTVIEDKYEPDEITGDVTVPLDFWVEGGVPPYDNVYIDYDYDFINFDEPPAADTVEVTPTPGEGHTDYDLVIPDASDGEVYYVAIRAYDTEAPNNYDTYAWMDPINVVVAGGIAVVNDGSTANTNAVTSDLTELGASYTQLDSGDISSWSDLEGYQLVCWCPYYTSYQLSSSEQQILMDYIDNGGSVFLPYSYLYATGVSSTFRNNYMGVTYFFSWGYYSAILTGSTAGSGPGGNYSTASYTNYTRHTEVVSSWFTSNTVLAWSGTDYYWGYYDGCEHDRLPGEDGGKMTWVINWERVNSSYRDKLLWNMIDSMIPDLI
jgi:hypothetical protein